MDKRAHAQFWAVADHFRGLGDVWSPRDAGYEFVRRVEGNGQDWVVRVKLHVSAGDRNSDERRLLSASVTWWPAKPRKATATGQVRKSGGWFDRVKERMRALGFSGDWERSPFGTFGSYSKALPNVGAVRREAARLASLNLVAVSSP